MDKEHDDGHHGVQEHCSCESGGSRFVEWEIKVSRLAWVNQQSEQGLFRKICVHQDNNPACVEEVAQERDHHDSDQQLALCVVANLFYGPRNHSLQEEVESQNDVLDTLREDAIPELLVEVLSAHRDSIGAKLHLANRIFSNFGGFI